VLGEPKISTYSTSVPVVLAENSLMTGAAVPPLQSAVWAPRPSNVSVAKPSHSTDGSKASVPSASPAQTVDFRCSVLSAVDVRSDPHWEPGSNPIWPMTSRTVVPFRSTTASSPLKNPAPLVWSACARIAALAEDWASTNTSPLATVPVRLIVSPAEPEPLKNIWTL